MSVELKKLIPRWAVFFVVAVALVWSLLIPRKSDFPGTSVVKGVYDRIDALPAGSPVLISSDFDPGSEAEMEPMLRAVLAHCWRKKLRVVVMTLCSPNSMPLARRIVTEAAATHGAVEGTDYALMNFKAGASAAILALGQSWAQVYPVDLNGTKISEIPAMKGITKLTDFPYALCIASVNTADSWVLAGNARYGLNVGIGCTAVSATDYYPYLNSKQITGLIGGLAGAAQYESLVKEPGDASAKMPTQSVIHVTIVLLIVIGNILHFVAKWRKS